MFVVFSVVLLCVFVSILVMKLVLVWCFDLMLLMVFFVMVIVVIDDVCVCSSVVSMRLGVG